MNQWELKVKDMQTVLVYTLTVDRMTNILWTNLKAKLNKPMKSQISLQGSNIICG